MDCGKCGQPLKEDVRFCGNCGTPIGSDGASEADLRIAAFERVLGYKYKILQKAGVGGFAEVYLGEHTQLGRKVAIKILHTSYAGQPEMIERFRRESKSAAKLAHPNIIDIYDVGEGEGINYFVMKYVEGETLSKKMHREKQLLPAEAISIIRQVADALAYAHEHEVIHRDIKPANVMLDEFKKPILMDFGIARVQFEGNLTKTGTLMGTPHYLPPEQPLGKPVDGRSDIYSLGVMFYEMLAGRPPFHDENSVTLIFKHINEPPPPLKDLVPDLAPELCEVVHKMLEKLPENRYQSADEVVDALDALRSIYPLPTPSSRGRTSGGSSRNTEQLLQLGRENLELQKFDKAIEIYATVVKRDPANEVAKSAINDIAYILAERFSVHIAKSEFPEAKQVVSQLAKLQISEEKIDNYRVELESAEQNQVKESEFRKHFEAARVALEHDNASSAIERLTSALTVNPSNKEAQDLLKQARVRYESNRQLAEFENAFSEAEFYFEKGNFDQALTAIKKAIDISSDQRALEMFEKINAALKEKAYKKSEQERLLDQVDSLCEKLQFAEALQALESSRADFPVMVENRTAVVQRSQALYEKYTNARQWLDQRKWTEAVQWFQEFLQTAPPYDFQVFYSLRKEAEETIKSAERESKLQSKYQQRKSNAEVEQQLKKADVLVRMGQLEQAREECRRLLKETDNHPLVQAKLNEIETLLPDHLKTPVPQPEQDHPPTIQFQKSAMNVPLAPPLPRPTGPQPKVQAQPPAEDPISGTRVVQRPVLPPTPPPERKSQQIRLEQPAPPPPEPSGKSPILYVLIGLGVIVLGGIIYFFVGSGHDKGNPQQQQAQQQTQQQQQHVAPHTTSVDAVQLPVSIDAQPWATINISGGELKEPLHETTPTLVQLNPGRYTIVFENAEYQSFTQTVDVHSGSTSFSYTFQQLDPNKLVDVAMK